MAKKKEEKSTSNLEVLINKMHDPEHKALMRNNRIKKRRRQRS